ncbi:MAG: GNAT family N-acetyltransferase [Clostridia bacterium]|nr:GNAT family N-acetyltransferase [Clostridia bacterium]
MKVVFKDKKDIFLDISFDSFKNYYTVRTFSLKNVLLGQMTFKIDQESFTKKIWLYKIETYGENQHNGIGSKMISFLERFAIQKRIYYIEGKYFPENDKAKDFYEHRGYTIEKDGYDWFVCKSLNHQENVVKIPQNSQQLGL